MNSVGLRRSDNTWTICARRQGAEPSSALSLSVCMYVCEFVCRRYESKMVQ